MAQSTVNFVGNSLFRNYNFGVSNHCFEIINRFPTDQQSTADECTSTCPTSYSGQFSASSALNGQDNDLTVKPYSANDLEDYQNGVSTADAVVILRHVNEIEYITDPYKMVAADCNNNKEIDSGDADEVEDLILEDIEFTRNSWEWFNALEINNNYGSFQSDPYSWTITDRWSGEIFWLNVSTSTLTSSGTQPQFFYYRSTKVGEVDDNESNQNDWVCDDYSFRTQQKEVQSIKVNKQDGKMHFLPGTTFKINFRFNVSGKKVTYFQLPLKIDYNYIKLVDISFQKDLDVKYKIKDSKNEFFACYLDKSFTNEKTSISGEDVVVIDAEVIQEFTNIEKVISIDKRHKLEAGDYNLINLEPYVEMEEFVESENPYFLTSHSIFYKGNTGNDVELNFFDPSGRIIQTKKTFINPGLNSFQSINVGAGFSFIRIQDKQGIYHIKWVN